MNINFNSKSTYVGNLSNTRNENDELEKVTETRNKNDELEEVTETRIKNDEPTEGGSDDDGDNSSNGSQENGKYMCVNPKSLLAMRGIKIEKPSVDENLKTK